MTESTPDISSATNPRVKALVALRKRRTRDKEGVTLVEGRDEIMLALDAGVAPQQVFFAPALTAGPHQQPMLDRVPGLTSRVTSVSRAVFEKLSYRESPDGWLAVFPDPAKDLASLRLSDNPLVLVCEGIEKPGNLGAMLRTAEAAGVDAVVAASPVTDWGNPNVVRASKGTVFAVPVAAASATDVVSWLRSSGLAIVVATPDTEALLTDLHLTGPLALVVGAEHAGVSLDWLANADYTAKLPMRGRVNSLNVSASAAIAVYEVVRQRGTLS